MTDASAAPERDAAWVVLETPLPPVELAAFCRKTETLYRINPFLEIETWQTPEPGRIVASIRNHSNGQRVLLDGRLNAEPGRDWRIDFPSGAKLCTRFAIEPSAAGSRLTITDEYRPRKADDLPAPGEVDQSLHAWGVALKTFLERDRRWGWVPLYRLYMRRVWLPMKPSARRIMFLVLVIALADVALVALGLAIYWLELLR